MKRITLFLLVMLLELSLVINVYASSGTLYEQENNYCATSANVTFNDYDNYGYISSRYDQDWWAITFDTIGYANFWMTMPSGKNYDLCLISSDGSTVLSSSCNMSGDELIQYYPVSKNRTYYVKIFTDYNGSTTDPYLFRAKNYPIKILSVPLYTQETTTTCGCACGKMILAHYGVSVSETDFKERASLYASGGDYTIVSAVTSAINYYLSNSNINVAYHYKYINNYSLSDFNNLLEKNIVNGYPIQINAKITSNSSFPYSSNGHYLTIKSFAFSISNEYFNVQVNDPHYLYSGTRTFPSSDMLNMSKNHSSGGYVICVNE